MVIYVNKHDITTSNNGQRLKVINYHQLKSDLSLVFCSRYVTHRAVLLVKKLGKDPTSTGGNYLQPLTVIRGRDVMLVDVYHHDENFVVETTKHAAPKASARRGY